MLPSYILMSSSCSLLFLKVLFACSLIGRLTIFVQAYIEAENMRLEREACQFWAKEIVVKIEYKFCPNLTIIDTPGLISAPPGHKTQSLQVWTPALLDTSVIRPGTYAGSCRMEGVFVDDVRHVLELWCPSNMF